MYTGRRAVKSSEEKHQMDYTHSEGPWVETAVKLVVRKADLDADFVSRTVSLPPTTVQHPGSDQQDQASPDGGLWILQVHERLPGGVDAQLRVLLDMLEPRSSSLTELTAQGYDIHLDLFGFVGRGATLVLSPGVVQKVAALHVPVTVTTSVSDR
ncbi:DUF4279 domain-containing protein [Streptomyces sp. NPDC048404]|uniref:DUF4279 domain-containing protein n=1 Tax=unclassified Streptomyces TaxID=2593676 RepID=UPI003442DB76